MADSPSAPSSRIDSALRALAFGAVFWAGACLAAGAAFWMIACLITGAIAYRSAD